MQTILTDKATAFASSSMGGEGGEMSSPDKLEVKVSFPLHTACQSNASVDAIKAIITASPEIVREVDNEGRLPLHRACQFNTSVEVVELLLVIYPESVRKKLKDGWLPLHLACEGQASVKLITALLVAYPESIREKVFKIWLINIAGNDYGIWL